MSWAIWITGPPGSGKSTIARAVAAELRSAGEAVQVLELDELRKTLTPSPTYSDDEREVIYRALGYLAASLTEAGVPVIIDATAHRRGWRNLARAAIPRFAEVQILCPLELCRARERTREPGNAPRGIYDRAGRPGATVPGVDVPYEPALRPELVIDTATEEVTQAVPRIVALCRRLGTGVLLANPPAHSTGEAIWITGRPGSGKTTLAIRVAEALARDGPPPRVLALEGVRRFLQAGAASSKLEEEIAHRALGLAARLLTEHGRTVIVDATAHRRAWRDAARAGIQRFAEVQLVCPLEICLDRERTARWAGFHDPQTPLRSSPDMALEYEESLRPELIVDTHTQDVWASTEQVLWLTRRLRRRLPAQLPYV